MALHPDFPDNPHAILDPAIRWFPADETLRETSYEKLLPPLLHELRKKVTAWRENAYESAADTSIALLNWWFKTEHLLPKSDGSIVGFQYYFAQREAVETIIYLHDVIQVKDKYDLLRFDSSGAISANIHRVYSGSDVAASADDEDTMDYFLGTRPTGATTDSKVNLRDIVRDIDELVVLNDEAHHIHDPKMAWFKSIEDIHNRLKHKD